MTREEWTNRAFQKIDPKPEQERKKRTDTRVFWFIYVPLGALVGFAATVVVLAVKVMPSKENRSPNSRL